MEVDVLDLGWQNLFFITFIVIEVVNPKDHLVVIRSLLGQLLQTKNTAKDFQRLLEENIKKTGVNEINNEHSVAANKQISNF